MLGELLRYKLLGYDNKKADGFRLTTSGYDFLALRAFAKRDTLTSLGNQIGVGKESDIYIAANEEGEQLALKLHRLGRNSFRAIRNKRDYHQSRRHTSWLFLAHLAAVKEFAYMQVLYEHKFPVPRPVDVNRNCIVMELLEATTLCNVTELDRPDKVYHSLMEIIVRLGNYGLVHCDFNEFNLMISDTGKITMIDFPQMISTEHENAEWYFDRDVACIRVFIERRFGYASERYPKFKDVVREKSLDEEVSASGCTKDVQDELSAFMRAEKTLADEKKAAAAGDGGGADADGGDASEDEPDSSDDDEDEEDINPEELAAQLRPKRAVHLTKPMSEQELAEELATHTFRGKGHGPMAGFKRIQVSYDADDVVAAAEVAAAEDAAAVDEAGAAPAAETETAPATPSGGDEGGEGGADSSTSAASASASVSGGGGGKGGDAGAAVDQLSALLSVVPTFEAPGAGRAHVGPAGAAGGAGAAEAEVEEVELDEYGQPALPDLKTLNRSTRAFRMADKETTEIIKAEQQAQRVSSAAASARSSLSAEAVKAKVKRALEQKGKRKPGKSKNTMKSKTKSTRDNKANVREMKAEVKAWN